MGRTTEGKNYFISCRTVSDSSKCFNLFHFISASYSSVIPVVEHPEVVEPLSAG